MNDPIRPAVEAFVEELAKALCAASSQQWRTNDGLSAWAVVNINPDASNNHWRYKARALLPIIEADRAAMARGEHDDLSVADEAADRIEQLERQLAEAREAITSLPPDALGIGGRDDSTHWYIRDELLTYLGQASTVAR